MDANRFDALTHRLTTSLIRRRRLGILVTLGLPGLAAPTMVEARKKKLCPPCKTRKKGKCKGTLPDGTACASGACQSGSCVATTPTCSDGVTNGSETDVDCGGTCPRRCEVGQRCLTRTDCAGALCPNGTCLVCALNGDCGSDAGGKCFCAPLVTTGVKVCASERTTNTSPVSSCQICPSGTLCITFDAEQGYDCFKPCGAA